MECYYVSREDSLCIAFFEDGIYNYNESKKLCEDNRGHLAVLDTLHKNKWVARMIESNTSKSSKFMEMWCRCWWWWLMVVMIIVVMVVMITVAMEVVGDEYDGCGGSCADGEWINE